MISLLTAAALVLAAQTGSAEVYRDLGLADAPAEFVVLVDTSASMATDHRYDSTREALRGLLNALPASDTVTVITFDTDPHVVDLPPQNRPAAVDRMPPPIGEATDTGKAISLAVDILKTSTAAGGGAIVMLTDGKTAPPNASAYSSPDSAAWRDLVGRGRELADRVRGFTIPLATGESGKSQLRTVIPDTTVLGSGDPDQIGPLLERLRVQFVRASAASKLRQDVTGGIDVAWPGLPQDVDLGEPVPFEVELTSNTKYLPLIVTNTRVELSGGTATGLPDRITLKPGERRRFTLTADVEVLGSTKVGRQRADIDVRPRLVGTVDTPWRSVLESELDLPVLVRPLDATTGWVGTKTVGISLALIWLPMLAVAVLVIAGYARWHRRKPRMHGVLIASYDGWRAAYRLDGKREVRFARPRVAGERGEYAVTGTGGGPPQIVYTPHRGEPFEPRRCLVDDELIVHGVSMLYRGGRSSDD
ncbi:vWA domain-containing protein [Actinokineospora cianjurensis]|uniref:von Willebrand factor type A domain-containing protein n=1 Tax=Actinokineospora cianjurensis TaxID=585224 RepID=A0A421AXK2_9PSEU|nr:vWA domain-containing protein [Actinokineospora cianjurensis]RLK54573.1 von Willebrand factor type A domain-containing protein [Actinokineospora cianjurensis]